MNPGDLDDPQARKDLEDLVAREIVARWYVTTPARAWGTLTHEPSVLKIREIASAVVRLVEDYRPGDGVRSDADHAKKSRRRVDLSQDLGLGDVPT